MKASLPFKYIICEKHGKLYVIFDFKDDNGKRKRKWVGTGLPDNCAQKMLKLRVDEIISEFFEEYCSGRATAVTEKVVKKPTLLEKDPRTPSDTVIPTGKDFKFTDFLFYWLDSIKATIAYTSYNGYRINLNLIKKYFDELYPNLLLTELTALQIQKFYNDMYNEGKTGNTVKHYHANIHKALKYAVKMDLLIANPADKVELPKLEKYRASFYSKEEINKLLKVFEGDRMELVCSILRCSRVTLTEPLTALCAVITPVLSSHLSMRQDTSRKLSGSISSVRCVSTICVIAVQVFCLPMEYP